MGEKNKVFPYSSFRVLRELKDSISFLMSYGRKDFKEVIDKEKKVYKEYLSKY